MLLSVADRCLSELAGEIIESTLVVLRNSSEMSGQSSVVMWDRRSVRGLRWESIEERGGDAVMLA